MQLRKEFMKGFSRFSKGIFKHEKSKSKQNTVKFSPMKKKPVESYPLVALDDQQLEEIELKIK